MNHFIVMDWIKFKINKNLEPVDRSLPGWPNYKQPCFLVVGVCLLIDDDDGDGDGDDDDAAIGDEISKEMKMQHAVASVEREEDKQIIIIIRKRIFKHTYTVQQKQVKRVVGLLVNVLLWFLFVEFYFICEGRRTSVEERWAGQRRTNWCVPTTSPSLVFSLYLVKLLYAYTYLFPF